MKRDVFISYRRKGGIQTALWVKTELERLKYDVFLDIEGLDHGPFDEQLYKEIDNAVNFVIILSMGALERCIYEDDWVRKEITHALEMNKNIIPFMLEEFEWPEEIPEEIRKLSKQQGIKFVTEYPAAVINKLTTLLVRSENKEKNRTKKKETVNINKEDFIKEIAANEHVEIIEPHKKKMFGFGFDNNDISTITERLEVMRRNLQNILSTEEVESIMAYRCALQIMEYVKKQMAAYSYWSFNVGKQISIFVKNYEPNLSEIESSVRKKELFLRDDRRHLLNQIVTGLDDIINSLKG